MGSRNKILKYITLILFAIIVVWFLVFKFEYFNSALLKITLPLVKAGNSVYLFGRSFLIIGEIGRENIKLSKENARLISELAEMKETERENIALRKQLELPIFKERGTVIADISGFDPFNMEGNLIINKGSADRLKKDFPVLSEEGSLIGKIGSVSENFAEVITIFSPQSSVAVISENSRSAGILKGSFGTSLSLEMVPQFENLSEGEILITSGAGGIFPKAIPAGKILEISAASGNVFKKARIKPLIDLHKTEKVIVILN